MVQSDDIFDFENEKYKEEFMRRKRLSMKVAAAILAAATFMSTYPTAAFAVTKSQVAADGVNNATTHVESDDEWNSYDVTVGVTVEDGKFKEFLVTPTNGYEASGDFGSKTYFEKAVNGTTKKPDMGIKALVGQPATQESIDNWFTANGYDTKSGATITRTAVKDAAKEALSKFEEAKKEDVKQEAYVLMNIPYAAFYAAEGDSDVDAVSSATKMKTRASLAAGSYHVNNDGSDISGITFPVKVSDLAALTGKYTQITDDSKVDITTTIKGKESTTTYTGKDALFENASYSYYVLSEAPSYYKEATVDENGNVFDVEEETDGVVKEDLSNKARAAATYIVNFRANAAGASVGNNTTEYKEYSTNAVGYCYGGAGADAAYLGTENGKVKFMQSGVVGLVDQSKVQVVNLNSAKSYSNYYADGSSIIHRICMDMTTPGYGGSVNVGPQQSYMKTGTTYYSYDGHYFYTNYVTMLSDYKSNTRKNSINPNNPYYNYYQYLPLRGKSSYSANELSTIINKHAQSSSKMYNKGAAFVNNQNSYGVNALLMTGVGALESAWGTSSIAKQKNNLFGLNAVDTSPGQSANTFSSVDVCIKDFAETYMSKQYLRAGWAYYHGGFLGDKASGINVSYASDPYWGEKIAALAWKMDSEGGKKDQNKYSIGIKDTVSTAHTTLNVRKEASTSATSLYNTGTSSNYAFLILGESGDFYKVQSDPVLKADRGGIESTSGKYNSSSMYAYASKQYIKKINTGTSGLNGGNTAPDTKKTGVIYSTHIQSDGWQASKANGEISGTTGEAKRIEAIKIQLSNIGYTGSVQYSTHVQSNGWKNWVSDGTIGGTTGEAKRMEAIRIRLTGEAANHYDIYYRVHTQTYGWLDWAKNGEIAGTTDGARRMEAIQIKLVSKGSQAPGSTVQAYVQPLTQYSAHLQTYGWKESVYGGGYAGTTGEAKRMEAFRLKLTDQKYSGEIKYRAHVQSSGWQGWKTNNAVAGTVGAAKRMEAIRIELTGKMAQMYDVYYRVHAETYGWLDWAKNGEIAGTTGCAKRLECIQVVLVKKGAAAPGNTQKTHVIK